MYENQKCVFLYYEKNFTFGITALYIFKTMCLKMLTNVPKNLILIIYVYSVILKKNLFYFSVY